jgi:hypothetical protein
MTQAVAQILSEVERLSPKERVELRRAIVERVPMSEDLTEDDFAALAADMFRSLDEEEEARGARTRGSLAGGLRNCPEGSACAGD